MKKHADTFPFWSFAAFFLLVVSTGMPSDAFGQAGVRAVFVSNNGNLEGSVSSFTINPELTLHFAAKLVTGTRPSTSYPCAGCNAYEISLTPSGQYIALVHPAGDVDGITIVQVGADAALSQVIQIQMAVGQDGPMDVQWLDNQYLAVLRTTPSPNQLAIYRFVASPASLTQVHVYSVGSFSTFLALHPSGQYLYAANSSSPAYQVYVFRVDTGGALTQLETEPTGSVYALELAISRDGTKLYSAGGISGGGHAVVGMTVGADGRLTTMTGSPFVSPGQSPSNVYVSDDNHYCFVGHGSDATLRVMAINQTTGALSDTGYSFDVGTTGTFGDVRSMRDLVFVTNSSDTPTGIYSFRLGTGGSLIQNGSIVSTTGIAPRSIAAWTPPISGDMDCDGDLDVADIDAFVLALVNPPSWAGTYPYCNINRGDMNGNGLVDGADIQLFVDAIIP
jgi:6-phosphogluconolactonase (cycloisomerase 2 family)